MRFEELFVEAARLDEPPAPADVVGQVRRKQPDRRLAIAAIGTPLALAAAVLVALVAPSGETGTSLPVTGSPTASAGPSAAPPSTPETFFAVRDGHAVQESRSRLINDFGPAVSVSPVVNGAWISRKSGRCRSTVQLYNPSPSTSFQTVGLAGQLAVSPDGRWLAYARGGTTTDPEDPGPECGPESLVVRDIRSGKERMWPGSAGGISSLSWAPDSRRLVFQTVVCCDRTTTLFDLDTTTQAAPLDDVSKLAISGLDPASTFVHDPAFAGGEVLVLVDDFLDALHYRVATVTGKTVVDLQEEGVSLDGDASGHHLLVSLYGDPERTGPLLSITLGKPAEVLGRRYDNARW